MRQHINIGGKNMDSKTLVSETIRGRNPGITPIYGWVRENMSGPISKAFGSVEAFEDHYHFDLAHLFGGPAPFDSPEIRARIAEGGEILPEELLALPLSSPDEATAYEGVRAQLQHYSTERGRFCYVQTPGFLECYNDVFGIENHLCWLMMYPDEIKALYERQLAWTKRFASNMMDLGVDMIHVSDDWGSQRSLLVNPEVWRELIGPCHAELAHYVKERGFLVSLHSDGCIQSVLPDIRVIGYDLIHPWQESSNMPYDLYLNEYQNTVAIMGGLCVQTTLGFGDYDRVSRELERVFGLLKGKRWVFCTTHYVQAHCSVEELVFAFDKAVALAQQHG